MNRTLVNVAFPLPLGKSFTYQVPEELASLAQIGSRVMAPFGKRRLTGFIVDLPKQTLLQRLKPVDDVLDLEPVVSNEIFRLAIWISDYYLCSLGEALKATVPALFLRTSKQMVKLKTDRPEHYAALIRRSSFRQSQILTFLSQKNQISIRALQKKLGAKSLISSLHQLQEKQLVDVSQSLDSRQVKPKTEKYVALAKLENGKQPGQLLREIEKRAPRQAACVAFLHGRGKRVLQKEVMSETGASLSTLKTLEKNNVITFSQKIVFRDYYGSLKVPPPKEVSLTEEQKTAVDRIISVIDAQIFRAFLLFGVTGSGKTQVYIEAITKTLAKGRDAIVLVPEISLTPQTVKRFRSHFQDQVAVLHSAMSEGERFDSWHRIKEGKARVVIGPRSAIFAPLQNVGLIVVDEEHESSYKQSDVVPRYHARDIAVVRAMKCNAVVILGSATPSAESFYNAQISKYELIPLRKRVRDVALPPVEVVDMAKEKRLSGSKEMPIFSRILVKKIDEKLSKDEQIILLLNRRGFSSHIRCHDCGFVEECDHCNISLTYHLRGKRLRCHYCGFAKKAPEACPECHGLEILFKGLGTQRVETEIKVRFPEARLVRMDLDTTSRKLSHDRILGDFGAGKYNILLGTQMVAKGLDFSRVTLVGVINADVGLYLPDFRAAERVFQLLTQVAGRAGRKDLAGEVIVQSYSPDHFCLKCAQTHDFQRFYSGEIISRGELGYPPFGRLVCIHFRGENEEQVSQSAQSFAKLLQNYGKGSYQVLGPTPSPINKIQNHYRYQMLLKTSKKLDAGGKKTREMVRHVREALSKNQSSSVTVAIDVDPVTVL